MSEILNELQLSPIEEKVYLLLLSAGQLSVHEIAEQVGGTTDEVEESIQSLIEKTLIYTNPSIVEKYNAVYPLVSLSEKAKDSIDTIQAIGNEINTYAQKRFDTLDEIVKIQKETIHDISSSAKEEIRVATESSSIEISSELDKLIEEIGQILNDEKTAISSLSLITTTDMSKHYQETTEKAGNIISSSVSEIVNTLAESESNITRTFENSSGKVTEASSVMENSLIATLDNNFGEYDKTSKEIQGKINRAMSEFDASAKDTMALSSETVTENYASIIESVHSRIGTHDKSTNQILEERIRNISDSIQDMNDDFGKVVHEKLSGIKREYDQMIETFTRTTTQMFIDANAQLEGLIAAKSKTNYDKLDNLFKILKDNLDKNATETRDDIKAKEVRLGNELRTSVEITQRKMTEINDKLNMELINSFTKINTDFETTKNIMAGTVTRAKNDINSKYLEARDSTVASISQEFKDKETAFTEISSKIIDDIRAINNISEIDGKNFIKDTEDRAKAAIARIEMPAKTLLNKGKQTAIRYVQEQSTLLNKTINDSQTGVEDTIIAETANLKNQFKGFGDKFKESNKNIERLLVNMELTYRELLTKIKEIPRPAMNTATILGREPVLNQMKEILSRVKSTVTVVYPAVSDVHLTELLNSNPRTRIIVISDFDPFKNADVIKQLMGQENIQLKSLAIGSTNKPYYAIGRDAEEGLIGTIDESDQVIGITSNSTAFVELINADIINAIITPKTKRVVLPET
ncbi:MAG: helix-turn-helix domain-containing protein [Candidatus Heimdallarchaeota archaeon]